MRVASRRSIQLSRRLLALRAATRNRHWVGFALVLSFSTTGCGDRTDHEALVLGHVTRALEGGRLALEEEFGATVNLRFFGFGSVSPDAVPGCTGTKVGERHFLTASHCVADAQGLSEQLLPGATVVVVSDNRSLYGRSLTVVQTSLATPHMYLGYVHPPGAAYQPPDAALIEVQETTPEIPIAVVDTTQVEVGHPLVKGGYGCEFFGGPHGTRYKVAFVPSQGPGASSWAPFLVTPGLASDPNGGSGCPGDSGSPAYRNVDSELLIVGVMYGGGANDYHTRLDDQSPYPLSSWLHGVGARVRPPSNATPFGGQPALATSLRQAEDFDLGGAGVGSLDNTFGNQGGAYRLTSTDIFNANYASGGYLVRGEAGEWLGFTVTAEQGASYDLELGVSGMAEANALWIELDGQDVSGHVSTPTAIESIETVIVPSLELSPGMNRLRVHFSAEVDLDYLTFRPSVYPCIDGAVSGNETDVDCGGDECKPCVGGQHCATDNDCISGYCSESACRDLGPRSVEVGGDFACAIFHDKSVRCWGGNAYGQLGVPWSGPIGDEPGEIENELIPVPLPAGALHLAAGQYHVCAILEDASVHCWGSNWSGQIGAGDSVSRSEPVAVDLDGYAVQLALGYDFSCVRLSTGAIKCWGGNGYGQLGIGTSENIGDEPGEMGAALQPVLLPDAAAAVTVGGGWHACVLVGTPVKARCWGRGDDGRLGFAAGAAYGDEPTELNPPAVSLGATFTPAQLAVGRDHTCVRGGGLPPRLKCWGNNTWGQLGYGDRVSRGLDPAQMGDNLAFVQLSTSPLGVYARGASTCATTAFASGNRVTCWGSNSALAAQPGQPQNPRFGDEPGELGGLPFIDLGGGSGQFSMGGASACVTMDGHRIKCWGNNQYGQLGLGDNDARGTAAEHMGVNLPPLAFP